MIKDHLVHAMCMDEYEPCERCGESRILDGAHRICFDCFIELDLEFHEKELMEEIIGFNKAIMEEEE